MKNKVVIISASVVILITLFILGSLAYKKEESSRLGFMAQDNFKKFVPDHAPVMGSESATNHLVEFLDPECESCREFYPHVKMIMNEYEGKLKLVIRYAPFHGNSKFVIRILEAARLQNKYWETLELLFQYQPYWGSHHNPRPDLIWNYLPQLGLDLEKLRTDMNNPEIQKIIEQDMKDGADLGVRATPTFFVNGKPLKDFGLEELKELISNEVK